MKIVVFSTAVLLLLALTVVRAEPIVHFLGATQDENEQLQGIFWTRAQGALARLRFLDSVIEKHPNNRQARLLRAECLLRMGCVDESERELGYLRMNHPGFPGASDTQAALSLAKGDNKGACEAYREGLKESFIKRRDKVEAMTYESMRPWYRARILELEGAVDEAEEAWKKRAREVKNPSNRVAAAIERSVGLGHLGRFYLRQGKPYLAVECFELVDQLERGSTLGADARAVNRVDWAVAQWAAGKRSEALRNSLETAQLLLNDHEINSPLLAHAILTARILAQRGVGTQPERERSAALFQRALATFSTTKLYSVEAIPQRLAAKDDLRKNATRVAAVLKAAPHLDSALWPALYQGLADPGNSVHLLDLLPPDTVQSRIASVEQKAADNGGSQ